MGVAGMNIDSGASASDEETKAVSDEETKASSVAVDQISLTMTDSQMLETLGNESSVQEQPLPEEEASLKPEPQTKKGILKVTSH